MRLPCSDILKKRFLRFAAVLVCGTLLCLTAVPAAAAEDTAAATTEEAPADTGETPADGAGETSEAAAEETPAADPQPQDPSESTAAAAETAAETTEASDPEDETSGQLIVVSYPRSDDPAEFVPEDDRIPEGVTIGQIEVSGMTAEEAETAVETFYRSIADSALTVNVYDKQVTILQKDLGFTWNTEGLAETAASLGKSGGLLSRYHELMDVRCGGTAMSASVSVDRDRITAFVRDQILPLNQEPVDAEISRDDEGEFIVSQSAAGIVTDAAATEETIYRVFSTPSVSPVVDATAAVTQPKVTTEQLSTIHDRLGTFATYYGYSGYGRKNNIAVAAGRLNGIVLMPGEKLSVSDTILPREPDNGYMLGIQFNSGETEEAYGGGVCQVSTTLYNALLRAELQIDERHSHSMVVSYVPYSSDAAIAEDTKDLVFTNNQATPIYIASYADGETLRFSVYGQETRPENRYVSFESTTLYYQELPENRVEDPTLPYGYVDTKGSMHPIVTSCLEKVVYIDDEEVSRELISQDSYEGSAKTTVVGTLGYVDGMENTGAEGQSGEYQEGYSEQWDNTGG